MDPTSFPHTHSLTHSHTQIDTRTHTHTLSESNVRQVPGLIIDQTRCVKVTFLLERPQAKVKTPLSEGKCGTRIGTGSGIEQRDWTAGFFLVHSSRAVIHFHRLLPVVRMWDKTGGRSWREIHRQLSTQLRNESGRFDGRFHRPSSVSNQCLFKHYNDRLNLQWLQLTTTMCQWPKVNY